MVVGVFTDTTVVEEVMQEFFDIHFDYYQHRIDYLEGMLAADSLKLGNQVRFICEKHVKQLLK